MNDITSLNTLLNTLKRMVDETVLTPQVLAIIASLMSLLSLVVSSIHCVCCMQEARLQLQAAIGIAIDCSNRGRHDER